ncbi:MAG TPA: hypothetical protein VE944_11680 [Nostoc sp.]|uniref:hypothetical protein n=1 Tax=Nostoc sp. TaxID=1180 RepID=UPI002D67EE41|nr:hypothetical protein [Nostoc sp.]HYX15001.1 hypothetical protein [Nostoc sp.]
MNRLLSRIQIRIFTVTFQIRIFRSTEWWEIQPNLGAWLCAYCDQRCVGLRLGLFVSVEL